MQNRMLNKEAEVHENKIKKLRKAQKELMKNLRCDL